MKYAYNAERDRIACKVWDPHFVLATFEEMQTKEQRSIMLHTCTDLKRHVETMAEKYANEGEILKEAREIPRAKYEQWLCGESEIVILGQAVPAKYVTDYLIAEDSPSDEKKTGRYGDLSQKRALLADRDSNLLQEILESWEKASTDKDIVRDEPEPVIDRSHEDILEK